jgi:ribosomal protein L27
MSVLPSDIVVYGSAAMPETDASTIGGAVDFTRRVTFYDITPTGSVDVISSSASDTGTMLTYTGRDSTGAIQSQTLTLNGQSWVTGSQSIERLLCAALSGASANGPLADPGGVPAVGDVALAAHSCVLPVGAATIDAAVRTAQTGSANHNDSTPALFKLQSGDGAVVSAGQIIWTKSGTGANQLRQIIATAGYGADIAAVSREWATVPDDTTTYKVVQGLLFEILPNPVTSMSRMFSSSAADAPGGSQRIYYEKVFVVNNNTAKALTGAQVEVANETPSLPSGALVDLALTTLLNDTGTVINRQTAPSSGVGAFTTQPAFVSVPGPGNLPSGPAPNAAGAQGVWLRLTLPAGAAAYKGSAALRIQGTTT